MFLCVLYNRQLRLTIKKAKSIMKAVDVAIKYPILRNVGGYLYVYSINQNKLNMLRK